MTSTGHPLLRWPSSNSNSPWWQLRFLLFQILACHLLWKPMLPASPWGLCWCNRATLLPSSVSHYAPDFNMHPLMFTSYTPSLSANGGSICSNTNSLSLPITGVSTTWCHKLSKHQSNNTIWPNSWVTIMIFNINQGPLTWLCTLFHASTLCKVVNASYSLSPILSL